MCTKSNDIFINVFIYNLKFVVTKKCQLLLLESRYHTKIIDLLINLIMIMKNYQSLWVKVGVILAIP